MKAQEAFSKDIGSEVDFTFKPAKAGREFAKGISLNGKSWDYNGPANQDTSTVWVPKGIPGYDLAKSGAAVHVTGTVGDYNGKKEIIASSLEAASKK